MPAIMRIKEAVTVVGQAQRFNGQQRQIGPFGHTVMQLDEVRLMVAERRQVSLKNRLQCPI